MVRASFCSKSASDGLSDDLRQCHLGSPVREICTLGSAWGDEFKKPRSLGEGTGAKASDNSEAPQRATASRLVFTILRINFRQVQCRDRPNPSRKTVGAKSGILCGASRLDLNQ